MMLALIGASFVFLGMLPTMFMKDDEHQGSPPVERPKELGAPVKSSTYKALSNLYFELPSETGFLMSNAHTWDGTNPPPHFKEAVEQFHHRTAGLLTMPFLDEDELEPLPELPSSRGTANAEWVFGVGLSLLAGLLFGIMFAPMPVWQARMRAAGHTDHAFDFVFAVCISSALTSTAWLIFWSTVKKLRNKPLDKSVLRPALLAGAIYFVAIVLEFYSIAVLPYAVAYTMCTGFALAASMGWGIFVFGEMKGTHNRIMAALSFAGVLVGAICLAGAA